VNIRWISGRDRDDPAYSDWLELRQRVLRDPLGLRYTAADLEAEREDRQLAVFEDGVVIGGLLIRGDDVPSGVWKVRQVAVETDRQGQGIGRMLMKEVVSLARDEGMRELVLNSRETVCEFYRKLGFSMEGEPFLEVGIPHRRMRLSL
jgi:predicted GNAT family N-acyltransferase